MKAIAILNTESDKDVVTIIRELQQEYKKKISMAQVKPLHYSKEFLNKSNEEIMKESIESLMKARKYEAEYERQLQEGKDPRHKTSEQILKDAEKRLGNL